MNQKKCPKCGENNPPEAVMCWACYTPLSGGAVAPATAGPVPGGPRGPGGAAIAGDAAEGGGGIPSWVYAAGGAVLVIALLVGAKVLLFGGGEDTGGSDTTFTQQEYPGGVSGGSYTGGSSSGGSSGGSYTGGSSSGGSSGGSGPTAPEKPPEGLPFSLVLAPNNAYTVGVMAIVPRQQGAAQQAPTIARFASSLYIQRHRQIQVYVFSDMQTATRFKEYQTGRKNAPLTPDDFNSLADVWPNTQAVCIVNKGAGIKSISPQKPDFWKTL